MAYGNPNRISFTGASSKASPTRGRFGDSMIAFMSPEQQDYLTQRGASGTINPNTGLPEYFISQSSGAGSQGPPEDSNPWGYYNHYPSPSGSATIEDAPVPDFGSMPAVQPSLPSEFASHSSGETATVESVANSTQAQSTPTQAQTQSAPTNPYPSGQPQQNEWSDMPMDFADPPTQAGWVKFANTMIDLGLFIANPLSPVAMGIGGKISEQFGWGAGVGFKPEMGFSQDYEGNTSFNAGLKLSGGVGIGLRGTRLGLPIVGTTFASAGLNFGADGVSTYSSGLSGNATSGDSNSNIGTSINNQNVTSNTSELANTDAETSFGQNGNNEGGPAHINPAEYASLEAVGYAPPILATNFGNFDDIRYVDPNAPI